MPTRPEIVPFAAGHQNGAGRLLAGRHRAHRLAEPGLDPHHEEPGAARAGIEEILRSGWVVTDWRMTNLPSSRAWPRLGFRPTFHRLFRAIP